MMNKLLAWRRQGWAGSQECQRLQPGHIAIYTAARDQLAQSETEQI